jgi:intracellular septation protein
MKNNHIFSKRIIKQVLLGVLLEFGPVVVFLLSFEFFHVYKATIILMVSTIVSTFVTFRIQKRLPYVALYVALLTSLFGYVTLTLHQPRFIQMRDTLYDTTCALTLIIGLMVRVQFLKLAFHEVLPMTTRAWTRFTYAWIGFFLSIAILNEYIRRTMSLQAWFDFKTIMVAVTVVFGVAVIYFLYEKEGK